MHVTLNSSVYQVPDFMIVGAARSGTTSIFYQLEQHPQISLSKIKEPNYFCYCSNRLPYKIINHNQMEALIYPEYSYSLAEYSALFEGQGKLLGEASTNYLYLYRNTIANITKTYGSSSEKLKIVIILRNPVDRAWSHYHFHKRNGRENLGFFDAVNDKTSELRRKDNLAFNWDYIGFGKYSDQIAAYQNHFKNVLIVLFEEFNNDPGACMRKIMAFLGVDASFAIDTQKVYNVSGKPKNRMSAIFSNIVYRPNTIASIFKRTAPLWLQQKVLRLRYRISRSMFTRSDMGDKERDYLRNIYRDEIAKLSRVTGRDLRHWLDL